MQPADIPLAEIQAAQERLSAWVRPTPLVPFQPPGAPPQVFLKLENLQPGGSFKLRGAGNALLKLGAARSQAGVWTASAGNMGLALAWLARQMAIPCTVVVPDNAARTKVAGIASFGARLLEVPFPEYQQIQVNRQPVGQVTGLNGRLVHPFADPAVIAGNATIGLEILADLPDVTTILVPYGGGGLSSGIALAIKALQPRVRVLAVEVETAAPFTASYAAGQAVQVPYQHSFVNGIGAPFVFPETWPLARQVLDGAITVSLEQVAQAIRLMAHHNHIIAEGAGAVATAAALSGQAGTGKIVCLVSGGNIDANPFCTILQGGVPGI
ncbi:MAG: pyridoxal-phosphate dependent enzyme [Anaerolineales bacterium]|nr:pyridoxal-phosphate dependent enzyme [Anaerolineales bacterium]